jgi:hypothetical protein
MNMRNLREKVGREQVAARPIGSHLAEHDRHARTKSQRVRVRIHVRERKANAMPWPFAEVVSAYRRREKNQKIRGGKSKSGQIRTRDRARVACTRACTVLEPKCLYFSNISDTLRGYPARIAAASPSGAMPIFKIHNFPCQSFAVRRFSGRRECWRADSEAASLWPGEASVKNRDFARQVFAVSRDG